MKIKSKSKRLIVLTVPNPKKGWSALHLGAGLILDDDRITAKVIKRYVDNKEIEEVVEKQADPDLIVLVEPVTEESLKALTVPVLKQYCKEKRLTPYAKLNEDDLVAKILASLVPAE